MVLGMQSNPRIRKIVIGTGEPPLFKIEVNGSEIELMGDFRALLSATEFQAIIQPENVKKMHLDDYYGFSFYPDGLTKKFINLKWLTMGRDESLKIICQKFPNLEVLQICPRPLLFWLVIELRQFLSSTDLTNKPSTISFNFLLEADRDDLHDRVIQFVDIGLWRINLNADGPFKHSIAFTRPLK